MSREDDEVLGLRLFIFASLAGICLWGLFSLLDNLGEPELLRSPKAAVVKGCDPIETPEAARLCPQFFCQKALLDAAIVPRSARFEVTVQRRANDTELVGGVLTAGSEPNQHFACVLAAGSVTDKKILSAHDLDALAAAPEWSP